MPQNKEQEISATVTLTLLKADFETLPLAKEKAGLSIYDVIAVTAASESGFDIVYTRNVGFKPEGFFSIVVCYSMHGVFTQDSIDYYRDDKEGFKRWVQSYKERLLDDNRVAARASALISSLCISAGLQPIVTSPHVRIPDLDKSTK